MGRMEVRFAHPILASIESDEPPLDRYPVPVIKSARRRINFLRAATGERDLRNWQSLYYEELIGDREGQQSIHLNETWRLIFCMEENEGHPVITLLEIGNHPLTQTLQP